MAKAEPPVESVAEANPNRGRGAGAGAETKVTDLTAKTDSSDWRAGIDDEQARGLAERHASPADLAKTALDLRQKLSNAVFLPGDGASDEDKATYRKALGVPAEPDGYEFALPEGRKATEADKAFQEHMAEVFHAAGVPLSTSTALVAGWNDYAAKYEAELASKHKSSVEGAEADLRREWRGRRVRAQLRARSARGDSVCGRARARSARARDQGGDAARQLSTIRKAHGDRRPAHGRGRRSRHAHRGLTRQH